MDLPHFSKSDDLLGLDGVEVVDMVRPIPGDQMKMSYHSEVVGLGGLVTNEANQHCNYWVG